MLIVLAINLTVGGCASVEQSVSVDNFSGHKITDFTIKTISGGFDFEFGTLIPDAHSQIGQKGYTGPMKIRPDDVCIATWLDEAEQKHEIKIDLSKQTALDSRSDLLFTLKQDGTIAVEKLKQ
jgi:hypothetical protein